MDEGDRAGVELLQLVSRDPAGAPAGDLERRSPVAEPGVRGPERREVLARLVVAHVEVMARDAPRGRRRRGLAGSMMGDHPVDAPCRPELSAGRLRDADHRVGAAGRRPVGAEGPEHIPAVEQLG